MRVSNRPHTLPSHSPWRRVAERRTPTTWLAIPARNYEQPTPEQNAKVRALRPQSPRASQNRPCARAREIVIAKLCLPQTTACAATADLRACCDLCLVHILVNDYPSGSPASRTASEGMGMLGKAVSWATSHNTARRAVVHDKRLACVWWVAWLAVMTYAAVSIMFLHTVRDLACKATKAIGAAQCDGLLVLGSMPISKRRLAQPLVYVVSLRMDSRIGMYQHDLPPVLCQFALPMKPKDVPRPAFCSDTAVRTELSMPCVFDAVRVVMWMLAWPQILSSLRWPGVADVIPVECEDADSQYDAAFGIGSAFFRLMSLESQDNCTSTLRTCAGVYNRQVASVNIQHLRFNVSHTFVTSFRTAAGVRTRVVGADGSVTEFPRGIIDGTVGDWLRWAGVGDLTTQVLQGWGYRLQTTGVQLLVRLSYNNLRPWHWVTDTDVTCTVTVTMVPGQWGYAGTDVLNAALGGGLVDARSSSGVFMSFVAEGAVGQASFTATVTSLVNILVLMGVATFVTDFVGARVLREKQTFVQVKEFSVPDLRTAVVSTAAKGAKWPRASMVVQMTSTEGAGSQNDSSAGRTSGTQAAAHVVNPLLLV